MKLLLHTCCGPCSIKSFFEFKKEFDGVSGFFYNPNVHPFTEYKARLDAMRKLANKNNFEFIEGKYDFENFLRRVVNKERFGLRCEICYRIRLEETARFAKDNGFESFSTTLFISPYQNHEKIKLIGEEIAGKEKIKFIFKDLTDLFKDSQNEAKQLNLYRQKYCGCIYSEKEKYVKNST